SVRRLPEAPGAGDPGAAAAGDRGAGRGRVGRRDDAPQRVPPEAHGPARGGGAWRPDLRPQVEHDHPDAGVPDVDLLARGGPPRGGPPRDRGSDRDGDEAAGAGGAGATERGHAGPAAQEGRAPDPRVAVAWPGAVSPRPSLSRP